MRKELINLRQKLDEEITYGTEDSAVNLARKGLNISKDKGFLGEQEYFKGQIELLTENFLTTLLPSGAENQLEQSWDFRNPL